MATLEEKLAARTATSAPELCEDLGGGKLRCVACGHRCRLPEGKRGICKVRRNEGGALLVPDGYVSGLQVDPIEKKPFFHVLPGSDALSFGMMGCDLHCSYCQNWITSQALRDEAAGSEIAEASPESLVRIAVQRGAPVVTSTYNEPLITADWAARVFDRAKEAGLLTAFVSNGNGTPEVLDFLAPRLDLMKVDLKAFRQERYRELGGVLKHVLATIEGILARGIWLEVVTLVVPGFNDSDEELGDIARFLEALSPDIPWHVTAFHPEYRMKEPPRTTAATLIRARAIGREAGLRYVYAGNAPGQVGDRESTRCPACDTMLVERTGYFIGRRRVTPDGACPDCGEAIAGRWAR